MKLRNSTHYLILGWLCTVSVAAFADTKTNDKAANPEKADTETSEQHAAHQHGIAKLMLATGGDGLEIMLETPASNVIGFEHFSSNDEEHKAIKEARHKLEAGDQLFEMTPEAGCSLLSADVTSALFEDKQEDKQEEKPEDKKQANEQAKEQKEQTSEQASEQPQTTDIESKHRDVDASWSFSCAKPKALKSVSILLFKAFPGFKQINAEWITESSGSALSMENDAVIVLSQ